MSKLQAAIAQLVARRSHNPKVVSSILTGRILGMSHVPQNARMSAVNSETLYGSKKYENKTKYTGHPEVLQAELVDGVCGHSTLQISISIRSLIEK